MKIISQNTSDEIGMFDIAIRFKPYKGRNEEIDNEEYLNEICKWIVESFTQHFVIIEKVDAIVVGGWRDNQQGWKQNKCKVNRDDHSQSAVYELRCHSSDAMAFMLRWS